MSESRLRAELSDYSRRIHARGWVGNHDGNLSVRLGGGRYLCTPGATSKAEVTPESLLIVDDSGARVSGRTKPFSEMSLHLCVYQQRPDVQAVVHAHPPHGTALAAVGKALDRPFLPEAVVSLGTEVPLVPLAAPGAAAVAALQPYVSLHDVVLIAGNGALAWGDSVEQAYLRLELCEHLARIALLAQPLGGVKPLPDAMLPALLEARKKAGLGPAARGVAIPDKLPGAPAAPQPPAAPSDPVTDLIREEIAKMLSRTA